ncbi:MAG: peptidoglycan-binding protein [Candidatus Buchananbacteria bacterium]|nr:peptidoglycan-binding protein [Candidatus Buchananbacteria bacterium]
MRNISSKLIIFSRRMYLSLFLLSVVISPQTVFAAASSTIPLELTVGMLVKGSNPEIFVYQADGYLHWIPDEATFVANKFLWEAVITLDDEELLKHSIGESLPAIAPTPTVWTVAETEKKVREFFADIPSMISIAECESGFRQFNDDGTVLKGSNLYVGIFQIDEKIHADWAKQLGLDIYTVEGNLGYAKHLYDQSGTRPWAGCVKAPVSSYSLTGNLKMGDENKEVKTLQQILNKIGYTVAKSGVGSPGNETQYFGLLTREAVKRFQCAKGIVCSGTQETTGYGMVGPKTRAALLK